DLFEPLGPQIMCLGSCFRKGAIARDGAVLTLAAGLAFENVATGLALACVGGILTLDADFLTEGGIFVNGGECILCAAACFDASAHAPYNATGSGLQVFAG